MRLEGKTLAENKHSRNKTLLPYLQKPESPPERNWQGWYDYRKVTCRECRTPKG